MFKNILARYLALSAKIAWGGENDADIKTISIYFIPTDAVQIRAKAGQVL